MGEGGRRPGEGMSLAGMREVVPQTLRSRHQRKVAKTPRRKEKPCLPCAFAPWSLGVKFRSALLAAPARLADWSLPKMADVCGDELGEGGQTGNGCSRVKRRKYADIKNPFPFPVSLRRLDQQLEVIRHEGTGGPQIAPEFLC